MLKKSRFNVFKKMISFSENNLDSCLPLEFCGKKNSQNLQVQSPEL